jgi:hypothetical protein
MRKNFTPTGPVPQRIIQGYGLGSSVVHVMEAAESCLRADPTTIPSSEPWIDASRWARVVGHWTLANRVFLWEFGDKLRNGKEPTDADRARPHYGRMRRDRAYNGALPVFQ